MSLLVPDLVRSSSKPSSKMARMLVENLPRLVIEKDLDELFGKYGRVLSMQIKFPPGDVGVALIEYSSVNEAEDACRALDGYSYDDNRLQTKLWHFSGEPGPRSHLSSQHRVVIKNLPPSATTKDVKDLLQAVADVLAVEVDRRGSAWASFPTHHELERVLTKLDGKEYKEDRLRIERDETPRPSSKDSTNTVNSSSTSRTSAQSTTAPSPTTTRTCSDARGTSTPRARSRSRSRSPPRYRRRSASRSPVRHRSSSDRRSRSRSPGRSSSRRYSSRSRSRSR